MQLRPRTWFLISLLLLGAAAGCWWLGNRQAARSAAERPVDLSGGAEPARRLAAAEGAGVVAAGPLPGGPHGMSGGPEAEAEALARQLYPHRLSNAVKSLEQWMRADTAILLRNALLDTADARPLGLPEHLRAPPEPGAYIVQARGAIDERFRAVLRGQGARVVSYIPNNAYLVRLAAEQVGGLAAQECVQAVVPYAPYYKLHPGLLALAVGQQPLPAGRWINLVLFAEAREEALGALRSLGVEVVAEAPTPFGPQLTVRAPAESWVALARLPSVQGVEPFYQRGLANDLTRVRLGVAVPAVTTMQGTNYLGLTGSNVVVNLNDTGVDARHPDLEGRVLGATAAGLVDTNGHGTHVAGILASSGEHSPPGTNAPGSVVGATYRGVAPGAKVFVLPVDLALGPVLGDGYLQETAARTNVLISNNSWNYPGAAEYNTAAASYDAAARDALPEVPGEQPLLFVFGAGNEGFGRADGLGGEPGRIASPGTAKNVITVGALDSPRGITNEVTLERGGVTLTNKLFLGETDSVDQVAPFSSRGNVGLGLEGVFGRFKPDVVAPGAFIVSTRSSQAREDPLGQQRLVDAVRDQVVEPGLLNRYHVFVPDHALSLTIEVVANVRSPRPMPALPIYARLGDFPTVGDFVGAGVATVANPAAGDWFYSIGNEGLGPVSFDLVITLITAVRATDAPAVLKRLNEPLGPHYRFGSGTSASAPAVSGLLALMQEFFEQRLRRTNSPALMKALLINGARSVAPFYDLNPRALLNYQGWGLVNLPNSLPAALTNADERVWPVRLWDQDPAHALATGQSRSWALTLSAAAAHLPLRVTLVWTDPPGNPNAALKLVNDLDLVVSNRVSGQLYYGNHFPAGADFTPASGPEQEPVLDRVNNVENVLIREPLDLDWVVTVVGRRVNVNAVSANTNDVVQDFALVIASGVTNAFSAVTAQVNPLALRSVQALTNGLVRLNQRVGAQPSMGPLPEGRWGQWNFYVFTNDFDPQANPYLTNGTNVAFVTFLPPQISRPRQSLEADVDLYVSSEAALLDLDPGVLQRAFKSTRRGGTEAVVFTNAPVGPEAVFYLGVKSEDQQGGEYALVGLSTTVPFEQTNGTSLILTAPQVFVPVPDGSPNLPGGAHVVAIGLTPALIQRVVVTNTVTHENFGDLLGNLSHEGQFAVLNNHRVEPPPVPPELVRTLTYVWDDSGQGDIGFSLPTDGPGSLRQFAGADSSGVWLLTMVDNSLTHTGRVDHLVIRIDPDLTGGDLLGQAGGIRGTVPPHQFLYYPIQVPSDAAELRVVLSEMTPAGSTLELYLRRGQIPDRATSDKLALLRAPGGELRLSLNDVPPLNAGLYWAGVYNPTPVPVSFLLRAVIQRGAVGAGLVEFFSPDTPQAILDEAVVESTLRVPIDRPVAEVRVGVRLDHPRASDLALRLISPQGNAFLLSENRGLHLADRYGGGDLPEVSYTVFADDTNLARVPIKFAATPFTPAPNPAPLVDSGFETAAPGSYLLGQSVEGWLVETNQVEVRSGRSRANSGTNFLSLADARVSRVLPTLRGREYALRFAHRSGAMGLFNTGVDDNGVPLPGGAEDPHYELVRSPDRSFPGPIPVVVQEENFPAFWLTNGASTLSRWISARAEPRQGLAIGDYVYRTGFDLSGFDPTTVQIQGHLAVDFRIVAVLLNGRNMGVGFGSSDRFSRDFIFNRGFKTGLNTLDFVVNNQANASGLRVEMRLTAKPLPSPTNAPRPQVRLAGVLTNDLLSLGAWQTNVLNFVAPSDGTPLSFAAGQSELRLDSIQLRELGDTWFLPEESLRPLIGESALGDWRLELWDNRAGPISLRSAELLSWRLQLRLANTNFAAVTLTNGQCYTGTVASNETRFFIVDAPLDARLANHLLTGSGDLVLLFNQNGLPTGQLPGDLIVDNAGPGGTEQLVLTTNAPPFLVPGQRYYLGVTTVGRQTSSDFTLCVDFGLLGSLLTLSNAVPYTNTIPVTNQLDYYQFVVSPTAYQVTFDLVPNNGNVDLFVSKGRPVPNPLPTPARFDYAGTNLGVMPEQVVIRPDSRVPLEAGLWFLGVQNVDSNAVSYTITATELTNAVHLIRLTNGVPLDFRMPPVRPITNYFVFTIDQTNALAQFDLSNLTGNGNLLLQLNNLPTENSFLVKDAGSPLAPARIRLRADRFLPVLNGDWFLTVANLETNDLSFTIRAFLPTGLPPIISLTNALAYTNVVPDTFPPSASPEIDYYAFDVSPRALYADFEVFPVNGNVDLVIRKDLPLPSPQFGDFVAARGGRTNEFVRIDRYSLPLALSAGRWYLGVFNQERHSVAYAVRATEYVPRIIPLANFVPHTNTIPVTNNFDYYSFTVSPDAARAVFEIVNPVTGINLFVQSGSQLPDLQTFDYRTFAAFGGSRRIEVTTNSFPVRLTPGVWHLGVQNIATGPRTYIIRAYEILRPGSQIVIEPHLVITSNQLCLTWSAAVGASYHLQGKTNLLDPAWTTLSGTLVATATNMTACIDFPTPYHFFRVARGEGLPLVSVVASDAEASETGADQGAFTFTRTGASAQPLTVRFAVAGTATEGVDYAPFARSIVIPAGASSFEMPLLVAIDQLVEGDETVRVSLLPDAAYLLGAPSEAIVTIRDAAAPPSPILIHPSLVLTNQALCLTFSSQAGLAYLVQGKSHLLDPVWTDVPATRVTATGASTTVCVPLSTGLRFFRVIVAGGEPPPPIVIAPGLVLTNHALCLSFSSGVGVRYFVEGKVSLLDRSWTRVAGADTVGAGPRATICISLPTPYGFFRVVAEGVSAQPVVTVSAPDGSSSETGDDVGRFTVSRSGSTALPLEVRFSLGGSAVNGVDYEFLPVGLSIPAGAASADLVVRARRDAESESDETVILELVADAAYAVGTPGRATVTIRDGPAPVPVVIDPTSISLTPAGLCFNLASQAGMTYLVQGKTNVTDVQWTELPETRVRATGASTTLCIRLPTGFQFFQVVGEAGPPLAPPVELRIQPGLVFKAGEVCLTWTSRAGARYRVHGKVNLADPAWTVVSPETLASGPTTTHCLAFPTPYHFFRVEQVAEP